ncbi:MAG: hypothetical protein K2X74_05515, partial [Acetobacteraceae bacterium]|nr:hypothetical protein [Acetobacteraceae bacterium]
AVLTQLQAELEAARVSKQETHDQQQQQFEKNRIELEAANASLVQLQSELNAARATSQEAAQQLHDEQSKKDQCELEAAKAALVQSQSQLETALASEQEAHNLRVEQSERDQTELKSLRAALAQLQSTSDDDRARWQIELDAAKAELQTLYKEKHKLLTEESTSPAVQTISASLQLADPKLQSKQPAPPHGPVYYAVLRRISPAPYFSAALASIPQVMTSAASTSSNKEEAAAAAEEEEEKEKEAAAAIETESVSLLVRQLESELCKRDALLVAEGKRFLAMEAVFNAKVEQMVHLIKQKDEEVQGLLRTRELTEGLLMQTIDDAKNNDSPPTVPEDNSEEDLLELRETERA